MPKRMRYEVEEKIDVFDNGILNDWCRKFNCERDELIMAVLNTGRYPKQVRSFLNKRKK